MMEANAIKVRIGELCHQFRLPTMGAQSVSRFTAAGHGDALETLLEVLEQEAEDRRQRRIGRLRTASRLPAGKPGRPSSTTVCPWLCGRWASCLTAACAEANVLAFGCPAPARPMHCAPGAGAGPARRQAGPGATATTTKARQLRLPAAGRPGVPAPRGRRVRGAHRRTLRTPVPGTSNLLEVLDGCGHRPGGPPLGLEFEDHAAPHARPAAHRIQAARRQDPGRPSAPDVCPPWERCPSRLATVWAGE